MRVDMPVPPFYLIRTSNGFFATGGDALGAAGCAGEPMVIPVASSSPREKPQVEPSGVQAVVAVNRLALIRIMLKRLTPPTPCQ